MAYSLIWTLNGTRLNESGYMNISYPSSVSGTYTLTVTSPAQFNGTTETLKTINLYLDGADANELLAWTTINSSKTTLNGGVDLSFDSGVTWNRFTSTYGLKASPSTWVTLPGTAIGYQAPDGVLNPYNVATILLRLVIPPSILDYRVYQFLIGVDFDVI